LSTVSAVEPHRNKRGESSRAAIFGAALELFQERGYEATTMRGIADRAGVSLGSSYHYFASKEHLVLEFYRHTHELHTAVIGPLLSREKDLGARLKGVIRAVVITCEPFHDAAGSIFSSVANPSSPVNPFGATARPLRDEVIGMYAEVVSGSDARILKPDRQVRLGPCRSSFYGDGEIRIPKQRRSDRDRIGRHAAGPRTSGAGYHGHTIRFRI